MNQSGEFACECTMRVACSGILAMFFLNLFWLPCIVVLLIIDTEPGSLRPVIPAS